MEKAADDREFQRFLIAASANDIGFWIDNFVWTIDPRDINAPKMPLVMFDKQAEFVDWLQAREARQESGLAEKSRDFGLTWLCCAYAVHGFIFRENIRFGFGSRKLEYVDDKDNEKCIFVKLRFILENLPPWMRPVNVIDKFALLKNPRTGCSIAGEGGDDIGRGDRTTVYFVDESASLPRPKLVDASLSQTTNCRIDLSTPKGAGNSFFKRRHSGEIEVFTAHWLDDPRKNHYEVYDNSGAVVIDGQGRADKATVVPDGGRLIYPWYEAQKREIGDETIIAQEIDIDYYASLEGIVIPAKWVQAAVELRQRVELPQNGPLTAAYDIAAGGSNKNVLGFKRGAVLVDILDWQHPSTTYSARKAKEAAEAQGVVSLNYDAGGGYGDAMATMAVDQADPPRFAVRALNGGEPPSNTVWPDKGDNGQPRTSKDKFVNARAEWWFLMRAAFRKSFEYLLWLNGEEGGVQHPLNECIGIPNHQGLIADLCKPLVEVNAAQKVQIESKQSMARRGVASPDFADMLAYLFAPEAPPKPGTYQSKLKY